MTVSKIYIVKLLNNQLIFTNNKKEIVDILNNLYKDNELFVPYNTRRINNLVYNNYRVEKYPEINEFKSIDMEEYYQEFLDKYRKSLEHKNYSDSFLERRTKEYMLKLYNSERLLRNLGLSDNIEELHEKLRKNEIL